MGHILQIDINDRHHYSQPLRRVGHEISYSNVGPVAVGDAVERHGMPDAIVIADLLYPPGSSYLPGDEKRTVPESETVEFIGWLRGKFPETPIIAALPCFGAQNRLALQSLKDIQLVGSSEFTHPEPEKVVTAVNTTLAQRKSGRED